jgi:2',3'-cyclic-nucleotide 2'-phosphodiesterase
MNILYIGDIMGAAGIEVVPEILPDLKSAKQYDLVLAQAENVTGGKSMSPKDMQALQDIGIDFFTGGNHTPANPDLKEFLEDDDSPVIGPANMKESPGRGWKFFENKAGKFLVISLLGTTVGREIALDNPLQAIDRILSLNQSEERVATIVNFHGDYSSEKRIIGYYLDGRVSAVIGDHWHTPTADAIVLPKGTAHISDVGMCGSLHSSLGITLDSVIPRWRDSVPTKNVLDSSRPYQFSALEVELDGGTGLAKSVRHIYKIVE